MPMNLSLDEMRKRRRERKWNENRRLRGRKKQEKAILRGIRSEDNRVFPYDDPCVHDKEASWEPPDYLDETLIDEENDRKVAELLRGVNCLPDEVRGSHPGDIGQMPWDDAHFAASTTKFSDYDTDSDAFTPEGKPISNEYDQEAYYNDSPYWEQLEDEHYERVWRAVARWTERARQESWPTDQGDIS